MGRVYNGHLPFEVRRTDLTNLPRPQTQIMLILGNPEIALQSSFLPNDGVGLARMEFVIAEYIEAHPMALLYPERIDDEAERHAVLDLARNDASPAEFFIRSLAEGIGTIAAAFYPKPVEEGAQVIERMKALGLERGKDGLEIYVMCEIPNNVVLIDEFSKLFDGFSIGSNDLTQLTLGVDRDSAIVAFDFDERDPGVKEMIRLAVEGCRRNQRHSGLCGQGPSDFPEFADFLVRLGIDSISLNPDAVVKMTRRVLEIERQLGTRATQAA